VLEAAFANRYEVDLISEMEIVTRDRGGSEQRRLVHAVSKRIDGRAQSIDWRRLGGALGSKDRRGDHADQRETQCPHERWPTGKSCRAAGVLYP